VVKYIKEIIKYSLITFLVLFLFNCANQLPPGGGEIDRIPPEITEVYPEDGTTNFSEEYFEITFSEYVDKRSVKEAIFISPAVDGNITLDWSGRSVRVEFPGPLRENTTYNITIGTDVADLNNRNKMAGAVNFSFSTGEQIDRRMITGKIFTEKIQSIFLFAYLNPSDTLNPSKHKPDYISQSGNDGTYRIPGLAAGTYRVFAVKDEFRDLLYQMEQDEVGIPFKEVTLAETDTLFAGLDFFLTKIDTASPRMLTSVMTDRNHLLLTFSEEVDPSTVSSKNFYLFDSTGNRRINPLYAYKNQNKPTELFLSIKDSIPETNLVYIFADTIKDIAGNVFINEQNSLTVSSRIDTSKPFLVKMSPNPGTQTSDFQGQTFKFSFNDGVDSSIVKNNITFTDTNKIKIKYNIRFYDDQSFRITPAQKLEPKKDYIISFDLRKVTDAAGNRTDTIYQYNFRTISGLDFTGINGIAEGVDFQRNPVLVLQGTDDKQNIYKKNINTGKFDFERIEAGKYNLWMFYDEDSSSTYTYGTHFPFKPSEEFVYYPDSLNLRPRWAITDLKFNANR
jgi:hypothetical protein